MQNTKNTKSVIFPHSFSSSLCGIIQPHLFLVFLSSCFLTVSLVKAGMVRVWVVGKTVWSRSERELVLSALETKFFIIRCYTVIIIIIMFSFSFLACGFVLVGLKIIIIIRLFHTWQPATIT